MFVRVQSWLHDWLRRLCHDDIGQRAAGTAHLRLVYSARIPTNYRPHLSFHPYNPGDCRRWDDWTDRIRGTDRYKQTSFVISLFLSVPSLLTLFSWNCETEEAAGCDQEENNETNKPILPGPLWLQVSNGFTETPGQVKNNNIA